MPDRAALGAVSRRHLDALSDDVGIMQHAARSRPDPAHGYCTDDIARALLVDLLHGQELGWAAVADRARSNLRFLDQAFDGTSGRFRNFRRADGSWLDEPGSEDSHGRAMRALGETVARAPDPSMSESAARLFDRALPAAQRLGALRARSSALLGCDAATRSAPTTGIDQAYRSLAEGLRSTFESPTPAGWPWPEPALTYENGLPVEALIVAGRHLGSRSMVDRGLHVLDWLIRVQTAPAGHLSPIGNGWWSVDGERSHFDQQPIEATALLLAAEAAHRATGRVRYRSAMEQAYAWFLGANDLGLRVADPDRGACRDGLTSRGTNDNEGAESTLMWLIALEHTRADRYRSAAPRPPGERLLAMAAR